MYLTQIILSKNLMALQTEVKRFKTIRFTHNPLRVNDTTHMIYMEGSVEEMAALLANDIFKTEKEKEPTKKQMSDVWKDFCNVLFGKK